MLFQFLTYPLLLRKLTCNKNWSFFYETFLPSITLLANMLGSIIGGVFIDKLGRRPVFIIAALLALIAGFYFLSFYSHLLQVFTFYHFTRTYCRFLLFIILLALIAGFYFLSYFFSLIACFSHFTRTYRSFPSFLPFYFCFIWLAFPGLMSKNLEI